MEYKGAIFFDYDGTIVDKDKGIKKATAKTLEAFNAARKNGYLTALCSGRSLSHVPKIDFDFDCYVTANGACASNGLDDIFFTSPIPADITKGITEFCNENGFGFYIEFYDYCLADKKTFAKLDSFCEIYSISKSAFKLFDGDKALERLDDVLKMVVMLDYPEQIEGIKEKFGKEVDVFTQLDPCGFDIAKKGASKFDGIKAVARRYGIPLENTYAIGDGGNDYGMITGAGHGIVMKKHDPILDGVGEFVTEDVENEGVYVGLKHFGII